MVVENIMCAYSLAGRGEYTNVVAEKIMCAYSLAEGEHMCIYMSHTCTCGSHTKKTNTLSGLIRLVISLECFIEITPFLCLFMND